MRKKLNIAVVDADESIHTILQHFFRDSKRVQVRYSFTDSKKFIKEVPQLDFDLCLLEIDLPGINGLAVAQLLDHKQFIFIPSCFDKLKDALDLKPIDIVTKPFKKDRLDYAIDRAFRLIGDRAEHVFFNVAESEKKIKLFIRDIVFVSTDDTDPRHKMAVLKGAKQFTLMDYSCDELLALAPHLVQVNKGELLAPEMVQEILNGSVIVRNADTNGIPKEIALGRAYRKELFKHMLYK